MEYSSLDSGTEGVFTDGEDTVDYEQHDYEDLDTYATKEQSATSARHNVEWSQRLLIASRILTIVHILLNCRLLVISWTFYSMIGRFFIMLPFALEPVLSLIFAAVGTFIIE